MTSFHEITYRIVVPVVFSIITICGLIGNLLVLFVIISKRQMRTVINILILNLAFADLLFISFVPLLTAFDYWHYSAWTIGLSACRFMYFIFNITTYVTVFTLVLISIIRYMVVVKNAATAHLRTKQRVSAALVVVWCMSFTLSIPVPFFYEVVLRCDTDPQVGKIFTLIFFFVGYVVPLLSIGVLYLCIIKHIQNHKASEVFPSKTRGRSEVKTKQAGKMLVLVLVAFFLLWLPIHIQMMLYHFGYAPQSNIYQIVGLVSNCLAYINSVVNPFIYNHSSKDFRDAFKEVVCFRPSDSCTSPTCCHSQKFHRLSVHCSARFNSKFNPDEPSNMPSQARSEPAMPDDDSVKDGGFFVGEEADLENNHNQLEVKVMPKSLSLSVLGRSYHEPDTRQETDVNNCSNLATINCNNNNDCSFVRLGTATATTTTTAAVNLSQALKTPVLHSPSTEVEQMA